MTTYYLTAKAIQALAAEERQRFVTVDEAAQLAGCTRVTIHSHIDNDAISWKLDRFGRVLVDREDVTLRIVNGAVRV